MQIVPLGRIYDFMGQRRIFALISIVMFVAAVVSVFVPGMHFGTDFKGGTEIEVAFKGPVDPAAIRNAVAQSGFSAPDVIKVDDFKNPNHYIIRVQEVSTIPAEQQAAIERNICYGENLPADVCPPARASTEVKYSPGGDKITLRFREAPDLTWIKQQLSTVPGLSLRAGANNPQVINPRDNKVEVQLQSKGDQLMEGLRTRLGANVVPDTALRAEWIGPKAGAQLRDAALKSIAIAIVFIMAYIGFRYDMRFAPGAVIGLIHDSITLLGFLVLTRREVNLTTVAAVLTVVGYSVNDTVVVYDRVRENLGRLRGASFTNLINISLSEMLSRTILTGSTVMISLAAFFFWGTGLLKDFALTLIVGICLGTYSSIYVALPFTEWLDRVFFARMGQKKKIGEQKKKAASPATASL